MLMRLLMLLLLLLATVLLLLYIVADFYLFKTLVAFFAQSQQMSLIPLVR